MNPVHWIMFQRVFGYGTKRAEKLLEKYVTPNKLFEQNKGELFATAYLSPKEMQMLSQREILVAGAERAYQKALTMGCTVLTPDHPKYPERLRHIYGKPLVLYVLGNVDALNSEKAIAIVGPRNNSEYGARVTEELAMELVSYDTTIVSGLARGIDAIAHRATLKAEGCTVAVLGNGIDTIYPYENRELHRLIIKNGGAIVSEFGPEIPAMPFHFPIRNRIVSGLSLGVVVIEGASKSGSLITAGHAIAQNRDVFAVPGEIYSIMSQATNQLIKQGAIMVTGVEDICEQYPYLSFDKADDMENIEKPVHILEKTVYNEENTIEQKDEVEKQKKPKKPIKKLGNSTKKSEPMEQTKIIEKPNFLDDNQCKIWDVLGLDPVSSDDICQKTQLPVSKVLATLTQLELFDLIITCPGRTFKIKA